MYFLSIFVVQNYFEDNMVESCAFILIGFQTGLIAIGPLIQLCLNIASWRWAMRMLALVCLPTLMGVVVFTPIKHNINAHQEEQTLFCENGAGIANEKITSELHFIEEIPQTMLQRFLRFIKFYLRGDFVLSAAAFFCFQWVYICPCAFLPLRAQTLGISDMDSSFLLTIFGAGGLVLRLFLVLVSHQLKRLVLMTEISFSIAAITSLAVPFCRSYLTLSCYSAVSGITLGEYE